MRDFVVLLGGAFIWPVGVPAKQTPAMPVVGLLRPTPTAPFQKLVAALRQGLAAELVGRGAALIVTSESGVKAVRAASATVPVVFVSGSDPIKSGLVTSLSRPQGGLTGVTFFGGGPLNA